MFGHVGDTFAVLACVLAGCLALAATAPAASVSLGDSYSSGEGAGPFDEGTGFVGGCHRSAAAWPRLLGVRAQHHLACSGATTLGMALPEAGIPGGPDVVSQLDRLRAIDATAPVERVLVTVGGNDAGFGPVVRDCVVATCLTRMSDVELRRLRRVVGPRVTRTLRAATRAAPTADIVLVGYPDLIPAAGEPLRRCKWLTATESSRVRRLQRVLNRTLARAAADAGADYADVRPSLEGHELCTRHSWVRPVGTVRVAPQQQGHPDRRGQRALAASVRGALARLQS